jgi:nucleotide-binding universal stress UspA family protein
VDNSAASASVVRHAAAVAEGLNVSLTVLHVLETGDAQTPRDPLDWDIRRQEALDYLAKITASVRPDPKKGAAATELRQGDPAEQILKWAGEHDHDLTVLCRHGRHGQLQWSLSSTARKLVEGTPGSVLVVPADGERAPEREPATYGHIMVPVDGSLRAETALASAVAIARAHGAELLIAHAVPAPELTHVGPPSQQDLEIERQVEARNDEVARGYLQRLRARLEERGLKVRLAILRGGDVRERLSGLVSREGVDLVVLSSHGRTGPRGTPCGGVAQYLLGQVSVPLLVLRDGPRRAIPAAAPEHAQGDHRQPPRAG